jgi:hypothetical protein
MTETVTDNDAFFQASPPTSLSSPSSSPTLGLSRALTLRFTPLGCPGQYNSSSSSSSSSDAFAGGQPCHKDIGTSGVALTSPFGTFMGMLSSSSLHKLMI